MNYTDIERKLAGSASILKRKPLFNGFVNDAPFNVSITISGKRHNHEGYQAWIHMLHRCYGKSVIKYPTYAGCGVADCWKSFMKFRDWWITAYVPGWCLDKDILGNGTLYSPDTCIYIPQGLNKILNTSSVRRGVHPLGVTKFGKKYRAMVSNPITDLHEFLGDYATETEAASIWRNRKNEIINELKPLMDSIDPRLYPAIKLKVAMLR